MGFDRAWPVFPVWCLESSNLSTFGARLQSSATRRPSSDFRPPPSVLDRGWPRQLACRGREATRACTVDPDGQLASRLLTRHDPLAARRVPLAAGYPFRWVRQCLFSRSPAPLGIAPPRSSASRNRQLRNQLLRSRPATHSSVLVRFSPLGAHNVPRSSCTYNKV